MNLREIQNSFYHSVLSGDGWEEGLGAWILPGGKLATPSEALAIHGEGYLARLTEALGEMYQSVWFILGDDEFFAVCAQYIQKHPSRSYNLNLYGFDFPSFIAQTAQAKEFPFLSELADFELSFNQIFHSLESPALPPAILHQRFTDNPQLQLQLVPSLQIKNYQHPIYKIWKACKEEYHLASVERTTEGLCLYKHQEKVFVQTLSQVGQSLLRKLQAGMALEGIFEETEIDLQDLEAVQSFFCWLTASGLVVATLPSL